jgi:hypothetical protein
VPTRIERFEGGGGRLAASDKVAGAIRQGRGRSSAVGGGWAGQEGRRLGRMRRTCTSSTGSGRDRRRTKPTASGRALLVGGGSFGLPKQLTRKDSKSAPLHSIKGHVSGTCKGCLQSPYIFVLFLRVFLPLRDIQVNTQTHAC